MLAILFQLGPIAIRWYALAYLVGFVAGWRYCIHLARLDDRRPNAADFDDFLTWAVIGVILGGRLGYVLFYNTGYYLRRCRTIGHEGVRTRSSLHRKAR